MKLIQRPLYIEKIKNFMNSDLIKIITGVRRCGKSTLFTLFQDYLVKEYGVIKEQIININLEDAAFKKLLDWQLLHDYVLKKSIKDKQNYVFIDEIQNVKSFEKAVNSLNLKKNIDIYLTGSNAKMLSSEIATMISGRYIEIHVLPLSFKEYLSFLGNPKNDLQKHFQNYLNNSSFPGALNFIGYEKQIDDYISGIYNTILIKDIITRKKIADVSRLENVVNFMSDIIGSQTSINNIYKTLKADGREVQTHTIEGYLKACLDSYIFYKVRRFDVKGKQFLKTNDKYYLVDIGFRNAVLGRRQDDFDHILENIVYLELLRRGYEIYIGKIDVYEVDFIVRKNKTVEYYQVAQTVMDENTLKREIIPFDKIKDHNQKVLLTTDYIDLSQNGIKHLNVFEWLANR